MRSRSSITARRPRQTILVGATLLWLTVWLTGAGATPAQEPQMQELQMQELQLQEPQILAADEQSRELRAPAAGVLRERTVRVDADALADVGGRLRLDLFDDLKVAVEVASERQVHHGWSWIGTVKGVPAGTARLIVTDGQLHGALSWPGHVVQLGIESKGRVRVREVDLERLPKMCAGTAANFGGGVKYPTPDPGAPLATAAADVDVLVLYTPAAASFEGEAALLALIDSGVEHLTNFAFGEGGVQHRVRIVGKWRTNYHEIGLDVSDADYDRLVDPSDGHMDGIDVLRNATGADLVLLVVQGYYVGLPTRICGIGSIGAPLDDHSVFSVVERPCLNYRAAPHELGHNFGLNHDWPDEPALYGFSHGYNHPFFHTIMSYGFANPEIPSVEIMRFSSPNRLWWIPFPAPDGSWVPMGDPNRSDAVRSLNISGGIVAGYRDPPEDVIPEAPTDLIPREDEENPPLFGWEGDIHAADHHLIVRDLTVGGRVVDRIVDGESWQPNPSNFSVGHSYEFSLRGRSRITHTEGDESERVRFDVLEPCTAPPTEPPVLHGPSGCVDSLQPIFTWTPPERATWSRLVLIEMDPTSPVDVIRFEEDVDGDAWQPDFPLTPGTTYRFKVKGKNRCAPLGGPYSGSMVFTAQCPQPPLLAIADAVASESHGVARFPVSLSRASQQTVSVRYATLPGSAQAGGDLLPVTGTLTFPPGATLAAIEVPLVNDAVIEPLESFSVVLSEPSQAVFGDATAVGTVVDDDAPGISSIAVYCPHDLAFHLRHTNTPGPADVWVRYGIAGDQPLLGDWDGDGVDTVGVFRPSTGYYYLRNENTTGVHQVTPFLYGSPGDIRITGDWNGDGIDTVGVYRPAKMKFYLRNSNTTGGGEIEVQFGEPGDVPIVGDWDGDGDDTIGVFRPSTRHFLLRNQNTPGPPDVDAHYGIAADRPVLGDWDGDGDDTFGIFRSSQATFYLRNSNTIGIADFPPLPFGHPDDVPLAGSFSWP